MMKQGKGKVVPVLNLATHRGNMSLNEELHYEELLGKWRQFRAFLTSTLEVGDQLHTPAAVPSG